MTAEILETRPAEPVADDGSYGGYAEIARLLNIVEPNRPIPYSRQLVQRWYKFRSTNRFPESHKIVAKSGKTKDWFSFLEFAHWYSTYRANPGQTIDWEQAVRTLKERPPVRRLVRRPTVPVDDGIPTIAMFQITKDGIPVW